MQEQSVGVVIPARNEEKQLPEVLKTVCEVEWLSQIVVVDDQSRDKTHDIARHFEGLDQRVSVIQTIFSQGKSHALYTGVRQLPESIRDVMFLDADLIGLESQHIQSLYIPLQKPEWNMAVAVFRGGELNTTASQVVTPYLSGQRCLKRTSALHVFQLLKNSGYGAEIGITMIAHWEKWKTQYVPWRGVTHIVKEDKYGFQQGIKARVGMYSEILSTMLQLLKEKNSLYFHESDINTPTNTKMKE
jgi:glycosyltransferase involved in cell wall biosynthesis